MPPDRFTVSPARLGPTDRPHFPSPPNRAWLFALLIWAVLLGWLLNAGHYWQTQTVAGPQEMQQTEPFDWRPQPGQRLPTAWPKGG